MSSGPHSMGSSPWTVWSRESAGPRQPTRSGAWRSVCGFRNDFLRDHRRPPGEQPTLGRSLSRSVRARPGLLLDDEVALDREHAAPLAQIEQLDQVGIDVQLMAVLAQATRDAEAQPLALVREPKGRVESGRDEAAAAPG